VINVTAVRHLDAPGKPAAAADITVPKALELLALLTSGALDHVHLVETRRIPPGDVLLTEGDVIVFDVEPEVPQRAVADIRPVERVAVTFRAADVNYPECVALRTDFPRDVPHLFVRPREYPWASLCLYEEPYSDVKLRWTAGGFVARVQQWLTLTSRGELHQDDQPLEPLIAPEAHPLIPLVLPPGLFGGARTPERLDLYNVGEEDRPFLRARRTADSNPLDFVALPVETKPLVHGAIRHTPRTLPDLDALLQPTGTNLTDELRDKLWRLFDDKKVRNAKLLIVVSIPKQRTAGAAAETRDNWAFMTGVTISQAGVALGLWTVDPDGNLGARVPRELGARGDRVKLELLRPFNDLAPEYAARLSALAHAAPKIVAIGAGMLGSQTIMHLARAGFGTWTIVDHDHLLPHNVVRHQLDGFAIGAQKARAVAEEVNSLFDSTPIATAVVLDVLASGSAAEMEKPLAEADVVLDMSASSTVARHLALDAPGPGRRVSLFLTPDGSDLVLLAEDRQRSIRLDDLEMQHYRLTTQAQELDGHLRARAGRIRYGQSCRDLTVLISQERAAIASGIAAAALRSVLASEAACIRVWRTNTADQSVRALAYAATPVEEFRVGDWKVRVDTTGRAQVGELRASRLPSETGGVLIGHRDMSRRILYVVAALPAPPDSEERPYYFDRGCTGLRQQVDEITAQTGGALVYVGDWHSHPAGHGVEPSDDDRKVFRWLHEKLVGEGFPAMMAIVGDDEIGFYVDRLPDLHS
jgi:integrative and conjugative element protein (TIGR02256 family)